MEQHRIYLCAKQGLILVLQSGVSVQKLDFNEYSPYMLLKNSLGYSAILEIEWGSLANNCFFTSLGALLYSFAPLHHWGQTWGPVISAVFNKEQSQPSVHISYLTMWSHIVWLYKLYVIVVGRCWGEWSESEGICSTWLAGLTLGLPSKTLTSLDTGSILELAS